MSKILKFKSFFKPCFTGFLFFLLFFLVFSQKEKNLVRQELLKLSQKTTKIALADSTKKSQPEGPEFLLLGKNSIKAYLPPVIITPQVLGSLVGNLESEDNRKIILEYIVEPGDTLEGLCQKFNISLNTILWANNLKKNSSLQPGQKLIIPPVSGVIHQVKEGDTVSEIAKKYKAKIEDIISFNGLSNESDIYIGDILIIPDGVMPPPSTSPSSQKKYASDSTPLPKNYFLCPVPSPCKITQGLHWRNAVDFGGKCGDPIYAAAGGKVLKVKLTNSTSPWANGGAGNNISILHPNGVVTQYFHLRTAFVKPGDEVSQGDTIALMGGQPGMPGAGMSTGCHLHFEVIGTQNPFAR